MNRRNILGVSATMAFGIALLSGAAVAQEKVVRIGHQTLGAFALLGSRP